MYVCMYVSYFIFICIYLYTPHISISMSIYISYISKIYIYTTYEYTHIYKYTIHIPCVSHIYIYIIDIP